MFVLQTKRRSKIRRKARGCFSFASNSLKFAEKRVVVFQSKRPKNDRPKIRTKTTDLKFVEKHVVVFRSKRPGNDRSFSGRLSGEIFAQNDCGRFLVVPSVFGLARAMLRNKSFKSLTLLKSSNFSYIS